MSSPRAIDPKDVNIISDLGRVNRIDFSDFAGSGNHGWSGHSAEMSRYSAGQEIASVCADFLVGDARIEPATPAECGVLYR